MNADCLSRYPLPSTATALVLDWYKGRVIASVFILAMMVGLASHVHGGEVEKDIWTDMEVLRFLQTQKYGNDFSAKERDCIYRRAKGCQRMGDGVFKMLH